MNTGYVYAISDQRRFVKIGWSATPESRLNTLACASPFDLVLVGYISASRRDEYDLHGLLTPWRARGEWYLHEGAVRHFVMSLPKKNIFAPPPRTARWANSNDPAAHSLKTTADVISALGGSKAVGAMFDCGIAAVSNWRVCNEFPAATYLVISDELSQLGLYADISLWRFNRKREQTMLSLVSEAAQ